MSLGNRNAKASNKGSNYSKELKQIKLLNLIEDGINGIGLPPSVLGLAKESTLQALLSAVDAQRDYEVRIVNDSNPGGEVTFLEVRYWDSQDGTLAPPVYYLPGDSTPYVVGEPGGPVAPLSYVPTSTLLTQILAELVGVNSELDAIKLDTANLDVALSTRATEATLLLAKGVLDNIKLDTAAIDANTDQIESLLTAIDAVLDNIKLDTANLDVTLSTRASEATLAALEAKFNTLGQKLSAASAPVVLSTEQEVILDAIKTAVEAINLDADSLAKETTLQATNALLTTIDGVLDNIKLDTANLDVALSTRATEATLAAVNAKLNSLGQKASAGSVPVVLSSEQEAFIDGLETLLTTIDAVLDDIKLDTAALVVDLAAIEVLQTSILSALTTIDGVLDNILLDTNAMVVDLAAIEILITTTNSLLTTIDGVIDQIQTNTLNTVNELTTANTSLNNIYNELLDQGSSLDALVIDAAAIEAELLDQGLSLDALVVDAAAIETELLDQGLTLDSIETELQSIDDRLTTIVITPNIIRATGAGSIPAGARSFSIANVGAADGDILGGTNNIKVGEVLNFDAGLNNTYGAVAYDATGTELLITYNN